MNYDQFLPFLKFIPLIIEVRTKFENSEGSRIFLHEILPVSIKKYLDFDQLGSDQSYLRIKDFEDK